MAAHSAGSLEEVFDNPLIFQTPTAERHSLLIVGFDNFMGIVVKYYCFWRQYALNKTHQCMYCLFMTIRCKTLPAPMITFISSPPESQDQWPPVKDAGTNVQQDPLVQHQEQSQPPPTAELSAGPNPSDASGAS